MRSRFRAVLRVAGDSLFVMIQPFDRFPMLVTGSPKGVSNSYPSRFTSVKEISLPLPR